MAVGDKKYAIMSDDRGAGDPYGVAKQSSIAYIEASSTASRSYAVGDYLTYNGILYRVTTAISSGGTITPGTNVTATTVSDEIRAVFVTGMMLVKLLNFTGGTKNYAIPGVTANHQLIFLRIYKTSDATCDDSFSSYSWNTSSNRFTLTSDDTGLVGHNLLILLAQTGDPISASVVT